eukprot:TRINITY_DN1748_c0_g1_i1.p1 TRINITY_DN1748_c0_g1~~TRINITY_DN1748_c0_g1_i1.p1  ORF type:complete len:492 (-),score=72.99 TRINITY_DN1748_c0_g1_i1:26-1501(-)
MDSKPPFEQVVTIGPIPRQRYGHTAVSTEVGGGLMIIWGGSDHKGAFCNDLCTFDFEKKTWSTPVMNGSPPNGRHFHSSVVYQNSMYIFGGDSNGFHNTLFRYHTEKNTWKQIEGESPPSARYGHTAVVFSSSMYIFGGFDTYGYPCNHLFEYSFKSKKWQKIHTTGVEVADVYHHSAVVYEGSMCVFGGRGNGNKLNPTLLEYRFGTATWSEVVSHGVLPSPRWGHRAVVCEGSMYIFGGRDFVTNFSDLFEFHFASGSWCKVFDKGIPRFFSSIVSHEDQLYIFGGRNIYNFTFNELFVCDLKNNKKDGDKESLMDDFRSLLNQPLMSDVTFQFPSEGKTIYAHRCILSARCAPLRAMFLSGMKESRNIEIPITSFKYATFYAFLEYLYTGLLYANSDQIVDLIRAADLYGIDHLKELCARKILRFVVPDNAIQIFLISDLYRVIHLKEYCIDIIAKNFDKLKYHPNFKNIPVDLLAEITDEVSALSLN